MNVGHLVDLLANIDHGPLLLPWPKDGNVFTTFEDFTEWKRYVDAADLDQRTPLLVADSFRRAQKLYLLGWLDLDTVTAGELAALISLEIALRDRYGQFAPYDRHGRRKLPKFSDLLLHMVEKDDLSDAVLAEQTGLVRPAVAIVRGEIKPTLADRRNGMAHGSTFHSLPVGGLLELVRDLIEYAYRDYYREASGGVFPLR